MLVRVIGPGCALSVVGSTLVVRDLTAPTPDTVAGLVAAFVELSAKHPEGFAVLYITGPSETGQLPDEASRKAVLQALREHKAHLKAIGYVVLLRGILASTMRSVGSALLYAARIPFPTQIFGDLDEGCRWIASITKQVGVSSPDLAALEKAATALLDRLNDEPDPN